MIDPSILLNKNFIENIENIELSEHEIKAIYSYLNLFEEGLSSEEFALWALILEKKDPKYGISNKEDTDSDS